MESVFIVGAVQAFFLTFLVINKKSKSKGDYIFAVLLSVFGLVLTGYTLEVIEVDTDFPVFLGIYTAIPMLIGPLIYLYVTSYTNKSQKFNPTVLLHIFPYVFFTTAVFLKLTVFSEGSVIEDRDIIEQVDHPFFLFMNLFRICYNLFFCVAALVILKKHSKTIGKHFSYSENIDMKWLRYIIIMMLSLATIVIITQVLHNFFDIFHWRHLENFIYTFVTIVVFIMGYYGIKQQIIFVPSTRNMKNPEKSNISSSSNEIKKQYLKSVLSKEDSQNHLNRLQNYMKEERPYLNGKLSLKEVAEYLDISHNHLSQVINENLNKNFFDFVNVYRVDLVKEKMLDSSNKNITLLSIAYDSGFNSKSSFNSIFKKITGLTPSQYLKSQSV